MWDELDMLVEWDELQPRTRRYRSKLTKNFRIEEICSHEDLNNTNCLLTHDAIPIRKIMVANIEYFTTQKDVKDKFARYGKIIDCVLKKKSSKSYAFITFKEAESASSAIRDGYHKTISLNEQHLRVLPAVAWHQPDRNKYTNNTLEKLVDLDEYRLSAYNHYSSSDESPISKLNEYCLLYIFDLLPIRDRIRIERVCRYWQIISTESLHLYKKLDSMLSYHNWQYIKNAPILYKILKKFGPYINKVNDLHKIDCLGNSTLIAIATLCPNIEEINLTSFPYLSSGLKALAKNCNKIKHFAIGRSKIAHIDYINKSLDKELSALFSKNRNLQYLHIESDIISGSCLKHLSTKDITHISLYWQDCSLYFRVISKIKNLLTLDIISCSGVEELLQTYIQCYDGLKLNAENIEKLAITESFVFNLYDSPSRTVKESTIHNFFKSCNLKNLKYLNLAYSILNCTDEFLLTLTEKFNHQLTYLDISGSISLTNSGLIYIITSLSKLEHFHMARMSPYVTDEIFYCGMPSLKTLNCRTCLGIRDEGLIRFINNSDKLEKLDVRNCELITNDLIFAAIQNTKHRKNEIVLTINVANTKININESGLKENSPFLQCLLDDIIDGANDDPWYN